MPIPWTGIVPATPTTKIAHGRKVLKASEQELIDWPASESTYQVIDRGLVGGHVASHSLDALAAAPTLTLFKLEGRRSAGTFSGYTINLVEASNVADP